MESAKKKVAIISVCSLLLIAMVVGVVFLSMDGDEANKGNDVSASKKAIAAICQTTDYQKTCMDSLAGQNSTNPKELIEFAFEAAIRRLNASVTNSTTLKELQTNPRAKAALDTCGELASRAIEDLHRSYDKFTSFDFYSVDNVLLDLKTWLSGAMTQQETCLDGFDDTWGDAGLKMKKILTTSMQMTSNALAMVAEISTFLESMGVQGAQSRRLLSESYLPVIGHEAELPDWMDFDRRELAQVVKPDLVVAKDGSGNYRTINEALEALPKNSNKTVVLYIKEGVYKEVVRVNSTLTNLMMIGDGPTKTRITGDLNYIDGTGTYHTATVAIQGDGFMARDIGFENSAGPEKHQAVALRVSADKAIFYNCQMDGYQDTLYVHAYRQFYRDCVISGTIDFIFGDSAAVFQGCTLVVRKPLSNQQNIVTAQGRKNVRQPTGLVLQNCTFKADPELYPIRHKVKSYLGRPWKEYSRTIIMESFLDDFIQPEGWLPWNETFALDTLFYTEFNNRGPASPKAQRVKWAGVKELPSNRIQRFTAAMFLDGDRWIPPSRIPYAAGFLFSVPKEDPNIKYSPVVPEENKDLGPTSTGIDTGIFSQNPTPPTPTTPPTDQHTPASNIAAPPTSFNPSDSAAAPSPLGATTTPEAETGEVIIDLSPIIAPVSADPAPTPSPTADFPPQSPTPTASPIPQPDSPSLPPTDASAPPPPPQADLAAPPSLSASGGSAAAPQANVADSDTDSSPPTTSAPAPDSESSIPLAGAPTQSFTE